MLDLGSAALARAREGQLLKDMRGARNDVISAPCLDIDADMSNGVAIVD